MPSAPPPGRHKPFEKEDLGVAATDQAVLDSRIFQRAGRRVDGDACYAASGSLQAILEPEVVAALNSELQAALASGELAPELAAPFPPRPLHQQVRSGSGVPPRARPAVQRMHLLSRHGAQLLGVGWPASHAPWGTPATV